MMKKTEMKMHFNIIKQNVATNQGGRLTKMGMFPSWSVKIRIYGA